MLVLLSLNVLEILFKVVFNLNFPRNDSCGRQYGARFKLLVAVPFQPRQYGLGNSLRRDG